MKIAIIGAGFYGIMAAIETSKRSDVEEVVVFEKSGSILSSAGKYNQARLHQGFHYPRSKETILQSKTGYSYYRQRFPSVAKDIDNNIYIIRNDGHVNCDEYLKMMDLNNLRYREVDISDYPFRYDSQGIKYKAIEVNEGYIDIGILSNLLKEELITLGVSLQFNTVIEDINCAEGKVKTSSGTELDFDLIINCSYTNPFLGFEKSITPIKYELCVMLLISSECIKGHAMTIMDGNFVSVYPWLSNLHSVSSVSMTPILKSENLVELNESILNMPQHQMAEAVVNIENHMKSLLNFEYVLVSHFSTLKVKIRDDIDDQRLVKTYTNGKCLTVLQGKLDAVSYFLTDLENLLEDIS